MGDFSANFRLPESGIHTVEGNVAGARAASLTKKRQLQQEEFEQRKKQIVDQNTAKSIHEKFAGNSSLSQAEQTFRSQTIGLVSAEDFKKAAQAKEKKQDDNLIEENEIIAQELKQEAKKKKKLSKKAKKKKRQAMSTLSFAHEDETLEDEETQEEAETQKAVFKDPSTDTSFLPDKQRELDLLRQRQALQKEWTEKQAAMRDEKLEIVYSYWDGSGHRRKVICKKGDSIGAFLEVVRKDLCKEFKELQSIAADALLYVKEDLILPFDVSFYDLIVTKARGKSGPLFHFDVHDDVRVGPIDSRIEKDESHPGKVVERKWYERNKHIFPASRWETYDQTRIMGLIPFMEGK